ncbi:MAG: serine hydrolase [Bacteroidetes bacterium RIFCSPHIGHO2_02_FULL_44_7]|nr:MAG: serine hydrolase [Bacteroidetes bacterium RIFCSPHIGHO2_02_FULL_44_7]
MNYLYTFLLCSFSLLTWAQQPSSQFIDSLVASAMKNAPHAGVAIAVVKDGKVLHSKGYGLASLKSGEKVNENTLFSIASNSKAFTTTALGILVDEGKLKWEDKVVHYLPEFTMYDPYVTAHFTILDLVTHRSGLGLGAGDLMFIPDGSDFTVDDVIRSFQYQTPVSEFRTKYDYDNLLYIVAGEVIHRVSGLSWDQFVEQRIMRPLGMTRSAGYYENLKDVSNVAMPHSSERNELVEIQTYRDPNKLFGAAGGIYASVSDLSQWMLCHLNNGTLRDVHLLSEERHDELWRPYTNISFSANPGGRYKSHYDAYGLGWELKDQNGYTIVSHTGGMPGMLSQTLLIPELNAGIVVLTNAAPGGLSYYSLTHAIKDEFLGMERVDWIALLQTYSSNDESESNAVVDAIWEKVKKAKMSVEERANYLGSYLDDWFGEVVIEERNGKLWFTSKRSPRLSGELFYYQANTFVAKWDYREMNCDAFVTFSLDENGKAQGMSMKGIAPNIDFSFDFQDLEFQRTKSSDQ